MQQSPSFAQLLRHPALLSALARKGYQTPTPIQAQSIPIVLSGHDLLGLAQTGTGKTAAFALPILQVLAEGTPSGRGLPRCLVLTPTRELCVQVADSFKAYGQDLPLKLAQVFGGVGEEPQRQALRRGVDVIIATPGRLLDFIGQGAARLEGVSILVLDEADRMLDMGFLPDMKRIISHLPKQRQTLLFSATMPHEIEDIAARWLRSPQRAEVAPVASTPERIDQSVYFVEKQGKVALLREVIESRGARKALVFTRTKHGADRVCRMLEKHRLTAYAIHGNKSQGARQKALTSFRDGETRLLVATDLAARGIDVKGIDLVINYDIPNEPETYVHRIGRTARAGAKGVAVSFCSREEMPYLKAIERLTRVAIEVLAVPEGLEQLASGSLAHEPERERREPARGEGRDRTRQPGQGGQRGHRGGRGAQGSARDGRDGRDGRDRRSEGRGDAGRRGENRGSGGEGPSRSGRSRRRDDGYAAPSPQGKAREGRQVGPAKSRPDEKKDVHHDHKRPLWERLVGKFTRK